MGQFDYSKFLILLSVTKVERVVKIKLVKMDQANHLKIKKTKCIYLLILHFPGVSLDEKYFNKYSK